jgi:trimeric autotransporter adhesin
MRRVADSICAALLCSCLTFVLLAQPPAKTTATVPRLVKFGGTLTDTAGKPLSGVLGVTFALYAEERGGVPLWMETQNIQSDANGRYTAMLGATRNDGIPAEVFASGQGRWLGVQPQGETERPRVLMVSVPYALQAADAETLGGLPPSAFALAGTSPAAAPAARSAPASAPRSAQEADAAPNLTGTGTADHLAYWTTTTAVGSSALYQTAAKRIGLGTTTPGAGIEVDAATATAIIGSATATSGAFNGVNGQTASTTGDGVSGVATATTGTPNGVYGSSASASGYGVYGQNSSTSSPAVGVYGKSALNGVSGLATASTGYANGVYGQTLSTGGSGVSGSATATTGGTNGVYGQAASTGGWGVFGNATATTGSTNGVYGQAASTSGKGVSGIATATTGSTSGVYGQSASTIGNGVSGIATSTTGGNNGVYGQSASASGNGVTGVNNATTGGNGVVGSSNATSGTSSGVAGFTSSTAGNGVEGVASAATGSAIGVYGVSLTNGGTGVWGQSPNTGVVGVTQLCNPTCTATPGVAGLFSTAAGGTLLNGYTGPTRMFYVDAAGDGYFAGNLTVTGKVTKGSGSFKIDHPLDPENKYLSHSFVESPDMMNIYNGNVTTDARGVATVVLPDYFEALNGDFRYQLTVIGQFAQAIVAREIASGRFTIKTNRPKVKVSWQVTGIRHDAYANAHRIPVTEDKPTAEQGTYLHPDVFGHGEGSQSGASARPASAGLPE